MTNKLMTLSEALATGRPFKHKNQSIFYQKNHYATFLCNEMYDPVWQVKEEEKPPIRVLADVEGKMCLSNGIPMFHGETDITESLAKALAPLIKKELGL